MDSRWEKKNQGFPLFFARSCRVRVVKGCTSTPVTEPTLPPEALTPLEVIERARICGAAIRERAVEAEKARRQPVETIQELTGSGLTRLLSPRRWGGYELDFATVVEAVYEISKADASAGWCYSFLLLHNWLLAYYPDQAQHDVWASSPDVHMADSIIPAGQVTRVEGGYRISGNWPFVSGIDHSTWAMLAGMMPEPATGPFDFGPHLFLLPHSDFAIEDTWFVAGLEASGSQNVVVQDAFVPAHRVVSMLALLEGISPGAQLNTNLMYHQPVLLHFPFGLTAPIVGAVMGAYELWCEMTRTKSTRLFRLKNRCRRSNPVRRSPVRAHVGSLLPPTGCGVPSRCASRGRCPRVAQRDEESGGDGPVTRLEDTLLSFIEGKEGYRAREQDTPGKQTSGLPL